MRHRARGNRLGNRLNMPIEGGYVRPTDMALVLALDGRPEHWGLCVRDIVCHLGLYGGPDYDRLHELAREQVEHLAQQGLLIEARHAGESYYCAAGQRARGGA